MTGRIHGWLFAGLSLCLIAAGIMRSRMRFAAIAGGMLLLGVNWVLPGIPKPDLVVHEEGQLVGMIDEASIATTETRPTAFIFEQWQRALPVDRHVAPDMVRSPKKPPQRRALTADEKRSELAALETDLSAVPTGRFRCRAERWCVGRAANGTRIVVMRLRELVGEACSRADLVVTSARLRWTECRSGAKLLSPETLRRSSTVEIWLDPENIRQFRMEAGLGGSDRPWYVHRTYDWRRDQFIPAGGEP